MDSAATVGVRREHDRRDCPTPRALRQGKPSDQAAPLRLRDIRAIRVRLQMRRKLRNLALMRSVLVASVVRIRAVIVGSTAG